MADPLEEQYPISCPFCNIASAYPHSPSTSISPSSESSLLSCIPSNPDVTKVLPNCCLVLSSPNVMAFLDIMPMTEGHLLVTCRPHRQKVADMSPEESSDVGLCYLIASRWNIRYRTCLADLVLGYWLPLLAKTVTKITGVTDYNIVQNNGSRAAQVVPHVHFHIIPRPGHVPELKSRSWTMFGRGQREDLDDEEGEKLASEMRAVLAEELERYEREKQGKGKL
jgi:diadenosine tetraphosphate (Ap4A) HIT family hydrolase